MIFICRRSGPEGFPGEKGEKGHGGSVGLPGPVGSRGKYKSQIDCIAISCLIIMKKNSCLLKYRFNFTMNDQSISMMNWNEMKFFHAFFKKYFSWNAAKWYNVLLFKFDK